MNTQINVESAIERSLGKLNQPNAQERFELRFWLSTEINGRKVESRGSTLTIEAASRADANHFARGGAELITERISGMEPKEANAVLPAVVEELRHLDAEWQKISHVFDAE